MIRPVAVLLLSGILIGCTGNFEKQRGISTESSADNQPRLKKLIASTDRLVIKHFFDSVAIHDPSQGQVITAGYCEFGPLVVYEPEKESDRLKGVRVEISSTYVRENAYSKPDKSVSFLDLDEVKDLDQALSYMGQTEQSWIKTRPTDDIEVTFTSKDDFIAVLFPNLPADMIVLKSGRIGTAAVRMPVEKLGELQTKLRQVLSTLESH